MRQLILTIISCSYLFADKPITAKNILDLACGNGRHSIFLANMGFDVVAIDRDEQKLTNFTIKKFKSQLNCIPKFLKREINGWSFLLILEKEDDHIFLEVNPYES